MESKVSYGAHKTENALQKTQKLDAKTPCIEQTHNVLMVRPYLFGYNAETARSNVFQSKIDDAERVAVSDRALKQFDDFVQVLREHNVVVHVAQDTESPRTPDSIFPNNWFSTHADGTLVFYPMSPGRQLERKPAALSLIRGVVDAKRTVDLTHYESSEKYLEGTGSLVLDRANRLAYACRSIRTDDDVLADFCKQMGYSAILFDAVDSKNTPIYHTNVMMCMGSTFVVICMECIPDSGDQDKLRNSFAATHKLIVEISQEQMKHFAGNMLEIIVDGRSLLVMSKSARDSLTDTQVQTLEDTLKCTLVVSDISQIETVGGGSARCMIAELYGVSS